MLQYVADNILHSYFLHPSHIRTIDKFSGEQNTSARASVKTGLSVCLAEEEHLNLFITNDQSFRVGQ